MGSSRELKEPAQFVQDERFLSKFYRPQKERYLSKVRCFLHLQEITNRLVLDHSVPRLLPMDSRFCANVCVAFCWCGVIHACSLFLMLIRARSCTGTLEESPAPFASSSSVTACSNQRLGSRFPIRFAARHRPHHRH